MAAREVLELLIKGDAKGAIEAFRGTSKAAEDAEHSVSRSGAMFEKLTGRFPVLGRAAEKFGIDATNAGSAAGKAAAVTAAAVGAFAAKSVQAYMDVSQEIIRFQRASGATAEEASKFVEVASDYGISAEQAAGSIGKLGKAVATSPAAFREYGIEIAKNADGTTDLVGTLVNAAGAFDRIQDPAKRAEMGTKLFGKSWQDLLPLLEKGSEDLRASFEGVSDLKILNEEDLRQAEEFRLALDDLKDAGEGLMIQVGKGLVPAISELAVELGKVTAQADKLTKPIGGLGTVTGGLVKSLREGSFALGGFKAAWQGANEKAKEAEEAEKKAAEAIRYADSAAASYVESLVQRNAVGAEQVRAAEDAEEAEKALRAEFARQKEATDNLARSIEERTKAQRDDMQAALEATTPTLRLQAAQRALADQIDDVTKAAKEAASAKNDDGKASRELQAAQDGLIPKLAGVAAEYANTTGAAKESQAWSQAYVDNLIANRGQYAEALGPAIAEYDKIIARIQEAIRQQKLANQTAAGYFPGSGGSSVGGPRREGGTNSFGPTVETAGFARMAAPITINVSSLDPQQAGRLVVDAIASYERTNGTGWRS